MGRPRRVSEPHSGGGWTTRVADAPPPEVRVGRVCVPVDHENLDRFGWSERTDEGRRRVVRSALRFAAEIGVQIVVPPADTPPDLPEGAVVVSQPPPEAFRSNGDWAADLMKRVARHYLADAREGPRAVESLLLSMRAAGMVQTPALRSISSHVARRTSPDRAAVSTRNSNALLVGTEAWEARTVARASATAP